MKKTLFTLFICLFCVISVSAQERQNHDYTILLTGASFADPKNGWFEIGSRHLNAKAINRAIGGEAIADTANRMAKGELYSAEELEEIDVFVIMQVHEKEVSSLEGLKEDYTDYTVPFDRTNYSAAYDYVIKRYMTECYNLKFNEKSKYFNTPSGKPAIIVLSTHWNDTRVIYNNSIRVLAERWGFPLIEFDKNIGFSKNKLHPVTKDQMTKLYTKDVRAEHGVEHGWHPNRGEEYYIQQRMAAIYVDAMRKVLPLK